MLISVHPSPGRFGPPSGYARGFDAVTPKDIAEFKELVLSRVWSPIVWREGVRDQKNFLHSHFLVLDFDEGPTIEEIYEAFSDTWHIIATTKSHQKQKGPHAPCDRFRLIVPFSRPIFCLKEYRYNTVALIKKYGADPSAKDGARFFYPCMKVVSWLKGDGLETEPVVEAPTDFEPSVPLDLQIAAMQKRIATKGRKNHIRKFLEEGKFFGKGRNGSCYGAAKDLLLEGLSVSETISLLRQSPFDRTIFNENEIDTAVNSAFKSLFGSTP